MATTAEQQAMIDAAWDRYRAEAAALRDLEWREYIDADERAFKRYLLTERLALYGAAGKAA